MKVTFEEVAANDKALLEHCEDSYTEPYYEWDNSYYLMCECHDGVPVRVLGSEDREPDDDSFGRSYCWISVELNRLQARIDELESK